MAPLVRRSSAIIAEAPTPAPTIKGAQPERASKDAMVKVPMKKLLIKVIYFIDITD